MNHKSAEPNLIQSKDFNPISLFWKDENEEEDGDPIGPLYYVDANGDTRNFEDSAGEDTIGHQTAKWLSLTEAEAIAETLGLEIKTF
jgi:hypothetical protein